MVSGDGACPSFTSKTSLVVLKGFFQFESRVVEHSFSTCFLSINSVDETHYVNEYISPSAL